MDADKELDLLRALVDSEPWRYFQQYCESQYSDSAVLARVRGQIDATYPGDEPSQHESVRSALAAQQAVLQVLAWPEKRVEDLKHRKQPSKVKTPVEAFLSIGGR